MTVSTKTLRIFRNEDNSNVSNSLDNLSQIAQIKYTAGESLLDILNANKINISQSCGGFGTCTTCRIIILSGLNTLPRRNEIEQERAAERAFADNERLSCQIEPNDHLDILIP